MASSSTGTIKNVLLQLKHRKAPPRLPPLNNLSNIDPSQQAIIDEFKCGETTALLTELHSQLSKAKSAVVQPVLPLTHSTLQSIIQIDCRLAAHLAQRQELSKSERDEATAASATLHRLLLQCAQTLMPQHFVLEATFAFGMILIDLFYSYPADDVKTLLDFFGNHVLVRLSTLAASTLSSQLSLEKHADEPAFPVRYHLALYPIIMHKVLTLWPTALVDPDVHTYWQSWTRQAALARPDISIDLLTILGACTTDASRKSVATLITYCWPQCGHLKIADLVQAAPRATLDEPDRPKRFDLGLFKKNDAKAALPSAQQVQAYRSVRRGSVLTEQEDRLPHRWWPVYTSAFQPSRRSRQQAAKCLSCHAPTSGMVMKCLDCGTGMHLACYLKRYPRACTTRDTPLALNGHRLEVSTTVMTHGCGVCARPCWGVAWQALACSCCHLVVHRNCVHDVARLLPPCGDLSFSESEEERVISMTDVVQELEARYATAFSSQSDMNTDLNSDMNNEAGSSNKTAMECAVWHPIISLQLDMLRTGLEEGALKVTELNMDALDAFSARVDGLQRTALSSGLEIDLFNDTSHALGGVIMDIISADTPHPLIDAVTDQTVQVLTVERAVQAVMEAKNVSLEAAGALIQQCLIVGLLDQTSRSPVLNAPTHPVLPSDYEGRVLVPIPFYHHPNGGVTTQSIRSSLASEDVGVNEFGLILLSRRCPVSNFRVGTGTGIVRALLDYILRSQVVPNEDEEMDAATRKRAELTPKLMDRYVLPWLRSLYAHDAATYEQILWNHLKVNPLLR